MLEMKLDPLFMEEFSNWFNADLVNLDNPSEVRDAAENCALYLNRKIKFKQALLMQLSTLLQKWTPQTLQPFIAATDADWLGDDGNGQILKETLTYIMEYLQRLPDTQAI